MNEKKDITMNANITGKKRGRKKKPTDQKLCNTVHVGLTDVDYDALSEISDGDGIGEAAEARRFIIRGVTGRKNFERARKFLVESGKLPANYSKLGQDGRIKTEEEAYAKLIAELLAEKLDKQIIESAEQHSATDQTEITEAEKKLTTMKKNAERRAELLAELADLEA